MLSVPVPSVVMPSLNVTLPVGLANAVPPGLVALTVAVNVTGCPTATGLIEDASAVVVAARFTTCVRPEDVLVAKLVSPL